MSIANQAVTGQSLHAFWWRLARLPFVLFVVAVALIAATSLDTVLARALFYDGTRWLGAQSWWTNEFLHDRSPIDKPLSEFGEHEHRRFDP